MINLNDKYDYVEKFKQLGFGLFVHYGLFSIVGKGEWAEDILAINRDKYEKLSKSFNPSKNWAKNLVKTAKSIGCKYITLTTRHHDGFSLFDTKGLSDFDIMHAKAGRDVIKEFVDECNASGIVPFLYHTLVDWHNDDYDNNFDAYLDYLYKSVEILCANYGKIGGFWFDGAWDKKDVDWKFDRLYKMIRSYQPKAMIINNRGMSMSSIGDDTEVDVVTFERFSPAMLTDCERPRAGEMCQVLNDHWGYTKNDINYKPISAIIGDLIDCRARGCNLLLNVGLKASGSIRNLDKEYLYRVGAWIKANKNFIYDAVPSDMNISGANLFSVGDDYYAVVKNVPMVANPNVQLSPEDVMYVDIHREIKNAAWLDTGEKFKAENGRFAVKPFTYGNSLTARVAKFNLK